MEIICVTQLESDDQSVGITPFKWNAADKAEKKFTDLVKELNPDLTDDEISDALEDGNYEYNGCSINIQWCELQE